MLNIITKNCIIFDNNSIQTMYPFNTISYELNKNGDESIIKFFNGKILERIENINNFTINGEIVTEDNLVDKLQILFTNTSSGSTSKSTLTYKTATDLFPENMKLGDYCCVTDDGTENTDILEIYQWSGFEWILYSVNYQFDFDVVAGKQLADICSNFTTYPPSKYEFYNNKLKAYYNSEYPQQFWFFNILKINKIKMGYGGSNKLSNIDIVIPSYQDYKLDGSTLQKEEYYLTIRSDQQNVIDTSGKIDIRNINFIKQIFVESISDYLTVEDIKASSCLIQNTTGRNIKLKNIESDSCSFTTSSYNIFSNSTLFNYDFDNCNLNTIYIYPNTSLLTNHNLELRLNKIKKITSMMFKNVNFLNTNYNITECDFSKLTQLTLRNFKFGSQEKCNNFYKILLEQGLGSNNIDKNRIDITNKLTEKLLLNKNIKNDLSNLKYSDAIEDGTGSVIYDFYYKSYEYIYDENGNIIDQKINKWVLDLGDKDTTMFTSYNDPFLGACEQYSPVEENQWFSTYLYGSTKNQYNMLEYIHSTNNEYPSPIIFWVKNDDKSFDITSSMKLWDYGDIMDIRVSTQNCDYYPSQEILNQLEELKIQYLKNII